MKKILLMMAAVIAMLATEVSATVEAPDTNFSLVCGDELDFNPIDISQLPAAVTEAVKKDQPNSSIVAASMAETTDGKKVFKLKMKDAGGEMSVVAYDQEGTKFSL